MHATDLDLSKLSIAERIQLAEDLWDSVAAEFARDPEAGEAWEVVRSRIEQRLDRAS